MNLKNNKGYVGTDAAIAILVLLIIIPTITGLIYNINKNNNIIKRKSEAISIAVNTIEAAKGLGIEELNKDGANIQILSKLKNEIYENLDTGESTLTKDSNTYKISIEIQDYAGTAQGEAKGAKPGYVKTIKVIVEYKAGKTTKNIELSTVIS